MTLGQSICVQKNLQFLFDTGTVGDLSDTELLERFVAGRDESAFEALVERHARMVLSICRGLLADPHDARMHSKRHFWCWCAALTQSANEIRSQVGCLVSPVGSPAGLGRTKLAGGNMSDRRRRWRRSGSTAMWK